MSLQPVMTVDELNQFFTDQFPGGERSYVIERVESGRVRARQAVENLFLRPGGRVMIEFGDGQADALSFVFAEHKWVVEAVVDDYSRRPRVLIARPTL